jgi:hypothetical protein
MAARRRRGARLGGEAYAVHVRGMFAAAMSVVLVVAGPARAEQVIEGSWSMGWRYWSCEAGEHTWYCTYFFTSTNCVETNVGVTDDVGARLGCSAWLNYATLQMQHRVDSAGRNVGCLSVGGKGTVGYYSSYPGMSHDDMDADIDVHDGVVAVNGHYVAEDGVGPARTYDVVMTFPAGCEPSTDNVDNVAAGVSVTIDVA